MQSHTGYICLTFLHCVFSNVSSNRLHEMMHNHIGCICSTLLHCVLSNVPSNSLPWRMYIHIGCIYLAWRHYLCFFQRVSYYQFYQNLYSNPYFHEFDIFLHSLVLVVFCQMISLNWGKCRITNQFGSGEEKLKVKYDEDWIFCAIWISRPCGKF